TGSAAVNWSVADTTIAVVNGGGLVTALTTGSTMLRIVSQANGNVKDSVPLVVRLPALATCTGSGGTLHQYATYTTPQVWAAATNPHYVTGDQTFASGSSLTVEAGALVCMGPGAGFYVADGAHFVARGTATATIVFQP